MGNLAKFILLTYIVQANSLVQIRMQRDFSYPVVNSFDVYWNAPTYQCKKHGVNFEPELKKFDIKVNQKDAFRGEEIIILYDPGSFPVMLHDSSTGQLKERNGGIPQLGDIQTHLKDFEDAMNKAVPKDFSGLGIIDFETWRPVFRQNWNDQVIYRNMSLDYERQKHPQWTERQILAEAKKNFEAAAKIFMDETLKKAKALRPNAKWGYYGFPYCLNTGKEKSAKCPSLVHKENDAIPWLFQDSSAFYPSFYSSSKLTETQHKMLVVGRLNEAWRMAIKVSKTNPPHVYPYLWYRYNDNTNFLSKEQMYNVLDLTSRYKMGGAIIWASSQDLTTKKKCQDLMDYLKNVMGPAVLKVKQNGQIQDDDVVVDNSDNWHLQPDN